MGGQQTNNVFANLIQPQPAQVNPYALYNSYTHQQAVRPQQQQQSPTKNSNLGQSGQQPQP